MPNSTMPEKSLAMLEDMLDAESMAVKKFHFLICRRQAAIQQADAHMVLRKLLLLRRKGLQGDAVPLQKGRRKVFFIKIKNLFRRKARLTYSVAPDYASLNHPPR